MGKFNNIPAVTWPDNAKKFYTVLTVDVI